MVTKIDAMLTNKKKIGERPVNVFLFLIVFGFRIFDQYDMKSSTLYEGLITNLYIL